MNRLLVLAFCLTATAAPLHAGEVIATAAGAPAGGAAPASTPGPIEIQDRMDRGDDVVGPRGPCGGPARTPDGKPDKTPHGEVFAGVGTHGYREGGGVACVPLGDHAAATIAVDVGRIDGRGWRR